MKFVYVIVANKNDLYYKQAVVSITSLKSHNPKADITIIIDKQTEYYLKEKKYEIENLCNELISVPFEENCNAVYKSRFLKTTMRELVKGDFLYIDTDTVIASNLNVEELDKVELGAVLDQHGYVRDSYFTMLKTGFSERFFYFNNYLPLLQQDDFYKSHLMDLPYYNGGLMWVKDTEKNHLFFKRWHKNWLENTIKGVVTDEPPLAKTNYEFKSHITEIPGNWNVQIRNGINFLENAKIIHLLATGVLSIANHEFCKPDFFLSFNPYSETDVNNLVNVKSCFCKDIYLISGNEFKFRDSSLYQILLLVYMKIPKLYKFLCVIAKHICLIALKIKKLKK